MLSVLISRSMSVPGAAASAARSFANRAVHVKVFPRTCNIQESREVLRVLKQFGPVVSFRNLNVRIRMV